MPASSDDYELLEARLKTLLPEEYQDSYENVQPVSMGSASLRFGRDGRVAWGEIWGSFCDLAMAGGPPHRGTLLEAATRADIDLDLGRYRPVVELHPGAPLSYLYDYLLASNFLIPMQIPTEQTAVEQK